MKSAAAAAVAATHIAAVAMLAQVVVAGIWKRLRLTEDELKRNIWERYDEGGEKRLMAKEDKASWWMRQWFWNEWDELNWKWYQELRMSRVLKRQEEEEKRRRMNMPQNLWQVNLGKEAYRLWYKHNLEEDQEDKD